MEGLLLFLQIMLINLVLSGDNAVVIALASKNLPEPQRKMAVWWGTFGAIGLRLTLTIVAVALLKVPYIQAFGSVLLLYIAIKLLVEEGGEAKIKAASTLRKAIGTIMIADLVMSLDNVLAIAAKAQGNMIIILLGIGLSIPIIVWGSTIVMRLLQHYPVLVYLGAGILGYTAGEMFVSDEKVVQYVLHYKAMYEVLLPILAMAFVLGIGMVKRFRSRITTV